MKRRRLPAPLRCSRRPSVMPAQIGPAAASDSASPSPPATVLCWFWHARPLHSAMPGLLVDLVRGGGEVADGEEKLRGGEKGW